MQYSEKYLEAIRFAACRHALNRYGDEFYYVHFVDIENVLKDHGFKDEEMMIAANLHDILEDGGISYNDVKKKFGVVIAEIVYLCTDNKGRSRGDRKNQQFYDEIKESPYRLKATKTKVADRIANARQSAKSGHGMEKTYKKEYIHFKEQLYIPGHIDSMWKELDELMEK